MEELDDVECIVAKDQVDQAEKERRRERGRERRIVSVIA